jgi:hypothetical protein
MEKLILLYQLAQKSYFDIYFYSICIFCKSLLSAYSYYVPDAIVGGEFNSEWKKVPAF